MRRSSLHALVPLVIGGAWAVAISHVRIGDITDLGLVSAMPASALALLALLTASFAVALARRPLDPVVALAHVLVLVVVLYGVTAFVEPLPRFSSLYRHAGIIDYISVHRSVNPAIDAYFNWPGFFALGALFTKVAGFKNVISYAAYGSLAMNLLFLPPLLAIFSWASDDRRVRWLAVWVFYICNWVGQDYIAPQAVGFLLWIALLAALLVWFAPRSANLASAPSIRAVPRWFGSRVLRTVTANGSLVGAVQSVGVMLVVVVMFSAIVAGHQLTPVPALVAVTALVVFAGLQTRMLPLIMAVIFGVWISYMTTTYLAGHLGQLADAIGSLGQSVNQTTARVTGSPDHEFVVRAGFLVTGLIWALAGAGFLRRLHQRRLDLALVLLGVTPLLLPVLQPYGGEIVLRVFFFSLPAVAFFIALLAYPTARAGRGWATSAAVALVGCVLLAGFQFTRYGNERMDVFTHQDLAAVQTLYRIAPVGSKLIAGTDNLPWRYQDYAAYQYSTVEQLSGWNALHPDPIDLLSEIQATLAPQGGYVIFTHSTQVSAELADGKPAALPGLIRVLRALRSGAREVYRAGEDQIWFVQSSPRILLPNLHLSRLSSRPPRRRVSHR